MNSTVLPALIVFGDRTATEVLETAQLAHGHQFSRIEKLYFDPQTFHAVDAVRLASEFDEIYFIAGISDVDIKSAVIQACSTAGWKPFTVIHPTAVVSPSATLGSGIFVAPLSVVSSHASVGDHSIIHIHSSIGHDSKIGQHCSIMPGARISGFAQVGDRTWIGSNSFVVPSGRVGADCRVDANSYVRNELPDGHVLSIRWPHPMRRAIQRP